MRLVRVTRSLFLVVAALVLAACASMSTRNNELDQAQYDWSAAIRWGQFAGARQMIDPEVLKARPLSDLEMQRYAQVRISSYRDVGSSADPEAGTASRSVQIGVINVHTQAERVVAHRETWRYDAVAKRWWNTSGLPDLWDGQ